MLEIREATETDFDRIWPIFRAVASAGDTYAYPTDVTKAEGKRLWIDTPRKTFVAEEDGEVLGTYYIKTNQAGPAPMSETAAAVQGVRVLVPKFSSTLTP